MKVEVGTIIRTKHNINNYPERNGYNWKYIYYRLSDGEFEVVDSYGGLIGKFEGKHFVNIGSDYWHGMAGGIGGLEILDQEYEIVENAPNLFL